MLKRYDKHLNKKMYYAMLLKISSQYPSVYQICKLYISTVRTYWPILMLKLYLYNKSSALLHLLDVLSWAQNGHAQWCTLVGSLVQIVEHYLLKVTVHLLHLPEDHTTFPLNLLLSQGTVLEDVRKDLNSWKINNNLLDRNGFCTISKTSPPSKGMLASV